MPIKGLTTNREPAFPRIGVLRKGGVKLNEKQPGKDLTYFRFDSDDKQAVQDFEATYGKEPATINVYLPFPTPDENFQAWQEEYKAGGLVHRCDGETMTVWQTPDGKYSNEPKPCPHVGKPRTNGFTLCKPVGRLTVIIPELRRFAYVTVGTTSKNDIMELTDNLNAVYAMRGTLQGIPFRLMRRPRMISTPKPDGGRARYEKWMLSIEADPAWVNVQIASMQRAALIAPDMKMLTGGRTVQVDTGEIFEDEEDVPSTTSLADVDEMDYDGDDEDYARTQSEIAKEFAAIKGPATGQTASEHTKATQSKQAAQGGKPDAFTTWANGIVEWALTTHRSGDTPCSEAQYDFLVSVIDKKIIGVDGAHNLVLSVLTGRPTTHENRVDKKLAGELLDYLLETKSVKNDDGTKAQVANEKHRPTYVKFIKWVYENSQKQSA